jgi:CheY-like chemotaxis protein
MQALIIEVETVVVLIIADALQELGYIDIHVAATQDKAISVAKDLHLDLITADFRLASGDPPSAVLAICARRAAPVVFITGHVSEVRQWVDSAIIGKPFDAQLIRAIAQARDALLTGVVPAPRSATQSQLQVRSSGDHEALPRPAHGFRHGIVRRAQLCAALSGSTSKTPVTA